MKMSNNLKKLKKYGTYFNNNNTKQYL